jgi:hypothetical protein
VMVMLASFTPTGGIESSDCSMTQTVRCTGVGVEMGMTNGQMYRSRSRDGYDKRSDVQEMCLQYSSNTAAAAACVCKQQYSSSSNTAAAAACVCVQAIQQHKQQYSSALASSTAAACVCVCVCVEYSSSSSMCVCVIHQQQQYSSTSNTAAAIQKRKHPGQQV